MRVLVAPICLVFATAVLSAGCNDVTLTGTGGDGEEASEPSYPEFDGATLAVHAPMAAAIYLLDEDFELDAEVIDAAGEPMDFDAITWTTDQDEAVLHEGRAGVVELEPGIHAITATAELPNGDRLQTTLGGVRVQGVHTGIYSGNLTMDLSGEFQDTPIATSCGGALDFVVDMEGEVIDGSGSCSLNLLVLGAIDVSYDVNGDIEDDEAAGNVSVDVGFLPMELDWEGGFENEDDLVGNFGGELMMFAMEGRIEAHRVSLYVDP